MKTKLNLNEPSSKIAGLIGLFLVVIPAVLYGGSLLLNALNVRIEVLDYLRNGSVVLGIVLSAGFLVLIVIEQIQDHRIDLTYQKNRRRKLPLADGGYECQYCGSQQVTARDKCCPVCDHWLE